MKIERKNMRCSAAKARTRKRGYVKIKNPKKKEEHFLAIKAC